MQVHEGVAVVSDGSTGLPVLPRTLTQVLTQASFFYSRERSPYITCIFIRAQYSVEGMLAKAFRKCIYLEGKSFRLEPLFGAATGWDLHYINHIPQEDKPPFGGGTRQLNAAVIGSGRTDREFRGHFSTFLGLDTVIQPKCAFRHIRTVVIDC